MSKFWCPEQKMKLILVYLESNTRVTDFIKACYVSEPTFRKWLRKYRENGLRGLCNEQEWRERSKYIIPEVRLDDLAVFKCRCRLDLGELLARAQHMGTQQESIAEDE